jgi:hypothetical protein
MLAREMELYVDTESMPGANSALTGVRCTKCKRHVVSCFMPVTLDSIIGATNNHTCKPFLTDRLDAIVRTLKGTAEELAALNED